MWLASRCRDRDALEELDRRLWQPPKGVVRSDAARDRDAEAFLGFAAAMGVTPPKRL